MEDTTFPVVLADLPNELLHVIVDGDIGVHHGLALACKRFFAVLIPISYSMKIDYAICAGHTVKITKNFITWYVNGNYHRVDGPAIEHVDGTKAWYVNGERHREDGPAVEWANGRGEWWVGGRFSGTSNFIL